MRSAMGALVDVVEHRSPSRSALQRPGLARQDTRSARPDKAVRLCATNAQRRARITGFGDTLVQPGGSATTLAAGPSVGVSHGVG